MNKIKNILIDLPVTESHKKLFANAAPGMNLIYKKPKNITEELIGQASIIIGIPKPEMLAFAKNLEWLQLSSAGANLYVQDGILPENVLLTNATGCYGLAISEYMVGVLLSLFLKLPLYQKNQQNNLWHSEGRIKSIYGSTALIVGLGDIGGEFAKRFKALGGYTIGIRRTDTRKPDYLDELYLTEQLDELLPRADVVALSLPETPQTHKLFDRQRLERIKTGAVLINVGRGMALDTAALCDVLNSGHLGGAAIDVTDPEPLPPEHPLWKAKNVVITPHVSGNYNLPETLERVVRLSVDNLTRYLSGQELNNLVDFSTGYKMHD